MLDRLEEYRTPYEVRREHEILLARIYRVIRTTERTPYDLFFREGKHLRRGGVMVYRAKTIGEAERLRDELITKIMPSKLERCAYMEAEEQFYLEANDVPLAVHIAWGCDYD